MKTLFLQPNGRGATWQSVNVGFATGRWISVETEIKLNAPGQSDGEVRVYVDGALVIERTGLSDVRNANQTLPLNSIFVGGWYSNGGNNVASCVNPSPVSRRYIDDIVVRTSYIGPEATVARGTSCTSKAISFVTPLPGTTQIEYGPTASYGSSTPLDPNQVTTHSQTLTGLTSGRAYHYRVKSSWSNGYAYASPDYTFVADTN
jgi:hypothetical protein